MSRIIVPQRRVWTRQPQHSERINFNLGIRPECLFVGSIPSNDLSNNANFTVAPSVTRKSTHAGLVLTPNGSAGAGISRTGGKTAAQTKGTFIAVVRINGAHAYQVLASSSCYSSGAGISLQDVSGNGLSIGYQKPGVQNAPVYVRPETGVFYVIVAANNQSTGEYYVLARPLDGGATLRASVSNYTSVSSSGNGIYGVGMGKTIDPSFDGDIVLSIMSFDFLPEVHAHRVLSNPWQLFARRDRRTIFDFGASGTTAVYADSALTYYIRSMLSSDSGVQYAIRNAIYHDDAVGYYLRNAIAQNNEVGYILRSAIAQDDAEAYKIRGLIQADDAESYNVRGLVQTTDSETYSIRGQVQTDATANYDIQSSTSVASTSTASYSVRGSVASDGVSQYSVRSAIQSDSSAGYSVRASAYRDVVSSYAIDAAESVVYSDLTTSYSIDGVAPACPTADQIAAAVLAQLNATTIPVNVTHFNGNPTVGSGTPADPVRPA